MLATAVRPGLLRGIALPRRPCTRSCRARSSIRLFWTVFTTVSLDALEPLRSHRCASGCGTPLVASQSWTEMTSLLPKRFLGIFWGCGLARTKQTVPKQPSQAIVEARKDEVCAIALSAAYMCFMRPINLIVEL